MKEIKLTEEELLFLDGKVNEEAQKEIDRIKNVNSFNMSHPLLGEILATAVKNKKLKISFKGFDKCGICEKRSTYAKYKSGPRKGQNNYKKPLYIRGTAYNEGFITMTGYASQGICKECDNKAMEEIKSYIMDNDLKVQTPWNDTKYIVEKERECYACHEKMWEFDMKLERTMMGDGYYYCGCPLCGAKSLFLGSNHESTGETRAVEVDTLIKKGNCYQREPKESKN